METCPCGSDRPYESCCQPLILGQQQAKTAEQLLRARYTAHVKQEIDFIFDTTHPTQRSGLNRDQVADWSKNSEWLGLEIVDIQDGLADDETGTVEFVARFKERSKIQEHREIAEFRKKSGQWLFFDGRVPRTKQVIRTGPKIGRNEPCPCGSGKKYKKCCGS